MNPSTLKGLLIDDDPDDTLLLMHLMSGPERPALKFSFTCAETLESGLKLLSAEPFDVILLDLMLPDSQGLETVLSVRRRSPEVPIVVLTGLRDESLALDALEHGAQDYQVKGNLKGGELKRAISHAVERQRLLTGLRNVIEGAPDGMVIVDGGGTIRYVNAAAQALLGAGGEPLAGKPFPSPLPSGRQGELRLATGPGEERIAELRVSDIEWKDRPAKLLALRDITELRQVERLKAEVQESRRMDRLKDSLMSAVSHEMRTPLTIIKATACQLKEELPAATHKRPAELLRLQHGSILRLEKIVNNILDLSRLESGKAEVLLQRIDPAALLGEAAAGFSLVAEEHGLHIDLELPRGLPPVLADPDLFSQLIGNLLDNALRFARRRVVVGAEAAQAGEVRFSVIDDGPGIPAARIQELFSKFVQVQRSERGSYHGTGLGLAICKEIAQRQGGRIWVESEEGRGCRFHFTLPRFGATAAHASRGAIASA